MKGYGLTRASSVGGRVPSKVGGSLQFWDHQDVTPLKFFQPYGDTFFIFYFFWITLPADLRNWDFKKKGGDFA